MSTTEAFLHDICVNPGDDVPRLVYADWLDEHGEPRRAEFIRLQIRLAGMDDCDPARDDLLDREWELLAVYRKRWRPAPESVWAKHLFESGFVRGFFARAKLPVALLLEHGDALFREYPLEELNLLHVNGRLGEVAARPWLAGVSSLNISHEALSPEEVRALFESPHLTRLRRLTLRNVDLTPEGLDR